MYGAPIVRTRRGHPSLSLLEFDGVHPGLQTKAQNDFVDEDGFESCEEDDVSHEIDEMYDVSEHVSRETEPNAPEDSQELPT